MPTSSWRKLRNDPSPVLLAPGSCWFYPPRPWRRWIVLRSISRLISDDFPPRLAGGKPFESWLMRLTHCRPVGANLSIVVLLRAVIARMLRPCWSRTIPSVSLRTANHSVSHRSSLCFLGRERNILEWVRGSTKRSRFLNRRSTAAPSCCSPFCKRTFAGSCSHPRDAKPNRMPCWCKHASLNLPFSSSNMHWPNCGCHGESSRRP